MEANRRLWPFRYTFLFSLILLMAIWFGSMAIGVADTTGVTYGARSFPMNKVNNWT